jgi:hypothetical protein
MDQTTYQRCGSAIALLDSLKKYDNSRKLKEIAQRRSRCTALKQNNPTLVAVAADLHFHTTGNVTFSYN